MGFAALVADDVYDRSYKPGDPARVLKYAVYHECGGSLTLCTRYAAAIKLCFRVSVKG